MFCARSAISGLSLARHWAVVVLICSAGISATLHAQETAEQGPNPQQMQISTDAKDAGSAKPGIFYDKDLDLSFNYPVEMRTLDARGKTIHVSRMHVRDIHDAMEE